MIVTVAPSAMNQYFYRDEPAPLSGSEEGEKT
jgi:hypothetical protein